MAAYMKRYVIVVVLGAVLVTICSCRSKPSPTTQPASPPVTNDPPTDTAYALVHALELFLTYEHTEPEQAKAALDKAAPLLADAVVDEALAKIGQSDRTFAPETILLAKRNFVASSWPALINYYRGYIEYPQIALATTRATNPETVRVVLPTHRPGCTAPVKILVVCVKEEVWRVKSVELIPLR